MILDEILPRELKLYIRETRIIPEF